MHRVVLLSCLLIVICNSIDWHTCLHCLCWSLNKCNTSIGCERDICGPFSITMPYWIDAGRPVLEDETMVNIPAYARCVDDMQCAKRTVRLYMERFGSDCNKDGIVDCYDYFILHVWGLEQCTIKHEVIEREKVFDSCMTGSNSYYTIM